MKKKTISLMLILTILFSAFVPVLSNAEGAVVGQPGKYAVYSLSGNENTSASASEVVELVNTKKGEFESALESNSLSSPKGSSLDYNTLFSTEEGNYKYAVIDSIVEAGTHRMIDSTLCNEWTVSYTQYVVSVEASTTVTHTVHFVTNGGSPVGDQHVADGGHATEPSTSRDGWYGNNWYSEPELINSVNFGSYTITKETTFYAGWYQRLVIATDGNGKVGPEELGANYSTSVGTFVLEGKTKNICAAPNNNYEFFGWRRNNEENTFSTSNPLAVGTDNGEEVTFTALFKPVSTGEGFTVKFDLGGIGSPTPADQHWDEAPHLVTAPDGDEPTSDTHNLLYWYKDDPNTPYEFGSVMESENFTLHAKWEQKPGVTVWTVNFDVGESETVINNQPVADNGYATRPAEIPEIDGWVFDDWYADNLFSTKYIFESTPITKNTTIYANYLEEVTLTLDVNGGDPIILEQGGDPLTEVKGVKGQTIGEILADLPEVNPTHPDGKVLVGITIIDENGAETAANMDGFENTVVTGDWTLRFEWANAITELDFTVTPPEVGSTTKTPKDGSDWDWDNQTNPAVIEVPEGAHYWLDGNDDYHYMYWVEDFENGLNKPLGGEEGETFRVNSQYNMDVYIELDNDYAITPDCVIKVNGEENGIVIDDYFENGKHYMELGLNICTPEEEEVEVLVEINGGNPIDKSRYVGAKGQTLEEILADLPELTHNDESLMFAWFTRDPEGNNFINDDEVINESLTVYAQWMYAVNEINLTITPPAAGTSTTTPKDGSGDWEWDSQTNIPVVDIVGENTHYALDEDADWEYLPTYWVTSFDDYFDDTHAPFVGTFEMGETYKAQIYLIANADYLFSRNPVIKINGEETGQLLEWDGGMIAVGGEVEIPEPKYTVTLNANGGSVTPDVIEVTHDKTYEKLPTPTKDGFNPIGWYRTKINYRATGCFWDTTVDNYVLRVTPHSSLNDHNRTPYYEIGDILYFDITVNDATILEADINDRYVLDYQISADGHNIRGYKKLDSTCNIHYVLEFIDLELSNSTSSYTINDYGLLREQVTSDTTIINEDHELTAGWEPQPEGTVTVTFVNELGDDIIMTDIPVGKRLGEIILIGGPLGNLHEDGYYLETIARKPLSEYSSKEELQADSLNANRASAILIGDPSDIQTGYGGSMYSDVLSENTTYYLIWDKIITEVEINLAQPVCGETVEAGDDGFYTQTNTPSLNVPEGKGYSVGVVTPEGAKNIPGGTWISKEAYESEEEDDIVFEGTFVGGETYTAILYLEADLGYTFPTEHAIGISVFGGYASGIGDVSELNVKVNEEDPYEKRTIVGNMLTIQPEEGEGYMMASLNVLAVVADIEARHEIEEVAAVEETCDTDGNIAYYKCTGCDKYFADATLSSEITDKTSVVVKAAHDWGDWETVTEPDFGSAGLKIRKCRRDPSHEDQEEIPALEYEITKGANQTHIRNKDGDLVIKCNGPLPTLTGITVGGKALDEKNRTLESGSTILTLKKDYLDSLADGKYEIMLAYEHGEVATNFTIATEQSGGGGAAPAQTSSSPITGDTIAIWISVMAISGIAIVGIIYNIRRKNK